MAADALPTALRECLLGTRRVGPPPGGPSRRGEARNAACGDVVVLWLAVEGEPAVVRAAGFKAQGCPAAMAAAAGACEVLPGLRADGGLAQALRTRFVDRFGEPRAAHGHALALVVEAAEAAAPPR
jgi:NifU-like protein involved in Fe-S cluster formation